MIRGALFATLLFASMAFGAEERVTFFTSYGYRDPAKDAADEWIIPIKLRVWEFGWKEQKMQDGLSDLLISVAKKFGHRVDTATRARVRERVAAFVADNESRETVRVRIQGIPDRSYDVMAGDTPATTDKDGRLDGEIRIPLAHLPRMPSGGWLSLQAADGHQGAGRVRLLENEGLSVISDIDDTVKVTEILEGAGMIFMNTFFREFEATDGMQQRYAAFDQAALHYVSGGPWQLYSPLTNFLKKQGFPEGSMHLRDFPLHPLNEDAWTELPQQILDPTATFDHKVREISTLLRRFPGRRFILVGDSGEKDPEVYREIQSQFGKQVTRIIIRDVAHEPERLKGMEIIEVPE